jgi:hypothetical protein
MDPNATLAEIDAFLKARQHGAIVDRWCEYLFDWLAKGGFEPDWSKYETGTGYYRCREIHIRKGERVPDSEPDYEE